jgi:hypothetical protein
MSKNPRKTLVIVPTSEKSPNLTSSISLASPINLKDVVGRMNRTLYKSKANDNKIAKLEKDTIRGQGIEKAETKPIPRSKKPLSLLARILNSEHKATRQGTQILKLPKLPFGKHDSYNLEPMFKDKHFLEDQNPLQIPPERAKDLEEITRKFRLHEKKYKANKQNRLQTARPTFSHLSCYDVYDMGPGSLVCQREDEVVYSYECDKERYKDVTKGNYAYTFKDLDIDEKGMMRLQGKTMNYKEQQQMISRLLPNKDAKDSALSQFYSTKYSSLFESNESKGRKSEFRRSSMS